MYIREVECPQCSARVILDGAVWEIGTVRMRCPTCAHYFLPPGSPRSRTIESVTNASVSITIWEPEHAR